MKATVASPLVLHSLRGRAAAVGVLALLSMVIACALTLRGPSPTVPGEPQKLAVQSAYGHLPLYFIKNDGQLGETVRYYERGLGHSILFTDEEILFHFETGGDQATGVFEGESRPPLRQVHKAGDGEARGRFSQVRLYPVHMQKEVNVQGLDPQEGKVNYFLGKNPANWKTDIPTYRSVVYREAYPGVDLKFYGSNERLEYDVIVNAGADPSQVKFGYSGIQSLSISEEGDLHLVLPGGGTLIHKKPLAYQEINGERREVEGAFLVEPHPGKAASEEESFVFGFKLAAYNPAYPLVIDPVLVYSSYLGGSGSDTGYGIAVDSSGYAYVTGRTASSSFPTASALDGSFGGVIDVFVTKFNLAGSALVYSTYLGGSDSDAANAIAVDSSGCVYLTGETLSTDFPTQNPYSSGLSSAGYADAFVVKLNANGSALTYSTYLGGKLYDAGLGIAVDSSGRAYVTGQTISTDFPIAGSALQASYGGGGADAFITIFNAAGSTLSCSTYLGGNDADAGYAIAVDGSYLYVTGETASSNFPITAGVQTIYGGGDFDAFVLKADRSTLEVVYTTYLGGSGADYGRGIAVASGGVAYVTGTTSSTDFPVAGAVQETSGGGDDAFVTQLTADGDDLSFSTYLGGAGDDIGQAIAVDNKGNAYVAGKTSGGFPTKKAVQSVYGGGGADAFVARIDCTEGEVAYSTYLGGTAADVGRGIALGTGGNVYVTGWTSSYGFPTTSGAFMTAKGGGYDVFVTKLNAILADFSGTPTSGIYPLTVAFTDTSEGTISGWSWNFGDNGTASTQNPTHTYTASGTYTVSLTVTGAAGEDTKTRTGFVKVAVPEVTITATTPSVPETGGGNGQFTVYRSAYTNVALTVDYTVSGTATSGTDFAALSGSLTIPKGSSSATISVAPIWDKINDGNETVIVTLTSSSLYSIGASGSATVTIIDSDLPTVSASASVASVSEKSSQSGLIVVSRVGLTTSALTVGYTVSGTAVSGTDYTALTGSVTIPIGATSANITVTPLWDAVYDGDKTVVVTLSSSSLYTISSPGAATVTIVDSDLPTVTIAPSASSISESGSVAGQYVVTHTGTTALALTVKYSVTGTAVSGVNYVALSGTVTIPAGSSTASIALTPIRDNQYTGDLTVVVSLTASSVYSIGSPNAATITIADSDLPVVTMSATQPNAVEATTSGLITVSRTGATTSPLTVLYTVGGTATGGVNYTALTGTVIIAAGAASATITVQPLEESLWQGPTTVVLTLAGSSQYTIGSSNSATVTIADNDGPYVTIAATRPRVAEADTGKGQFTVTRSAHTDAALTVTYAITGTAISGNDYVMLPGSITIPAGYASASILVTPLEDFVSDGDKTVVATITSSEWYKIGSPSSATVTIVDSDLPSVTIAATVSSVLEKGSTAAEFVVTRTGLLTSALVVNYATGGTATSGVDYTAPSGSVTIPAGSTSATISVMPLWDQLYDGDKTLVLTVIGNSLYDVGSPASASATIVDEDIPTVTITASVSTVDELASASGAFLVTHSGITTKPLTVNYTVGGTAKNGEDYTYLSGTVTIEAGFSSATILVKPIEDSVADDEESVVVTLASSSLYLIGTPDTATVTIFEPGLPTLSVAATTAIAVEATTSGQFTVSRTKKTTEALTVPYTVGGTAVAGTHYTALGGSVVIPVGSASATITVQPLENRTWDGPTSVILSLTPNALYNLGSASSATVTIHDNDGPSVKMSVIKNLAYEAGPVAGQVKVSRTDGKTTGTFPVAYSLTGTADNGVDYQYLSGSVVIPEGSDYGLINITPIDDDIDESRETVLLKLIDNGYYTIDWPNQGYVYIVDDDLPKVTVTAVDNNASESGNNNGIFRVERDGVITSSLLVYYSVGGTAANGKRYANLGGSVTISANMSSADILVNPYNDAAYQGNETVIVTILGTELYAAGSPDNATIYITDDDFPTVTVAALVGAVEEDGTAHGLIRVSRDGNAKVAPALEVAFSLSGTAVEGEDYNTTFSGSVIIPAGESSADIEIIPIDNAIQDDTRTVMVTLTSGSGGYLIGTANSAVVSILDDEMPTVSVVAADGVASETGTDTGVFTITRNSNFTDPLTVLYTVGGTATPGADYTALAGSVTIPAGAASVDLTVTPVQDQTAEVNETVILTLTSSSVYYVGSPNQATVTIVDDEKPVVSVTALRNATESGTTGQFQISRAGNTLKDLVVKFGLTGTAVQGVNYVAVPLLSITIPAGETSAILEITPIDDDKMTGDLTVILTLVETKRYQLDSSSSSTLAITDTDLSEVSVVATDRYAIEQTQDKGVFTVTRTRVSNTRLTVYYTIGGTAIPGSDYTALTGSVTIPKGKASAVIEVVPINDGRSASNRTVELTLNANAAYFLAKPSAATVSILYSDVPEVSLSVPDKIADKPNDTARFKISRIGPTTDALNVKYSIGGTAKNGTDYKKLSGTATIAEGKSAGFVKVVPLKDGQFPSNKTVIMTLNTDTAYTVGSPNKGTVTMLADNLPVVSVTAKDATATETGPTTGTFTVSRTGDTSSAATIAFTVSGTAQNGTDYVRIGKSVDIGIGATSVDIAVMPIKDALSEGTETVILTIAPTTRYSVSSSAGSATVKISE